MMSLTRGFELFTSPYQNFLLKGFCGKFHGTTGLGWEN